MEDITWKFYTTPQATWDAMYADCEQATVSIDLEQYIFVNDVVGSRFIALFREKAKQGVRVRLHCDMVGSILFYSSPLLFRQLIQDGIEIQFFNPISPWRVYNFLGWFFRDHRKILIVDNRVGYTGGIGINTRMESWRDTQVRLEGPVVQDMTYAFDHLWMVTAHKRYIKYERPDQYNKGFTFATNAPHRKQRFIYRGYIDTIRNAQTSIYLTTPYFIPDLRMFRVLRLAAKRGVDVRILVPGNSDHRIVDIASNSYFGLAMRSGIKIYKYHNKMIHAKIAIIDGRWASVGSTNLDNLSFLFNYEANLLSTNPKFVQDVQDQFFADLAESVQIQRKQWSERSLLQKATEVLSWPLHKFL